MNEETLLFRINERLNAIFERDREVATFFQYADDPYWPNYARGVIAAHQAEIQWLKQMIQLIEERGIA